MMFVARVTGDDKFGWEAGYSLEKRGGGSVSSENEAATFETHAEALTWVKSRAREAGVGPENIVWEEGSDVGN